jgi:hypothetical protein
MTVSSLRIVFSEDAAGIEAVAPFTVVSRLPYNESGMNDTLGMREPEATGRTASGPPPFTATDLSHWNYICNYSGHRLEMWLQIPLAQHPTGSCMPSAHLCTITRDRAREVLK